MLSHGFLDLMSLFVRLPRRRKLTPQGMSVSLVWGVIRSIRPTAIKRYSFNRRPAE